MTKRIGFYLFAAAIAGFFALQAADYKGSHAERDEKDIRDLEAQWTKAIQSKDAAALELVLASDYTLVDSNGKARAMLQLGAEGPTFALLNDDQSPLVSIGKAKSTRVGTIYFYDDRGNFAIQEGGRRPATN